MRHRNSRQRLNQKPDHAKILKRNLVTSLLMYESIRTTKARARVVRPMVDRLIRTAKTKQPHLAIRSINAVVMDKNASRKLMEVLRDRYASRPSGFTTIKPAGARRGDGAELVDVTLVDAQLQTVKPAAEKKEAPKKEKAPAKKATTAQKSNKKDDSTSAS